MIVWVDGELCESDAVTVSGFDLGVTTGLGAFETMRSDDGRVFALARHMTRLREGMRILGMGTLRTEDWLTEIRRVLEANGLMAGGARVRLTLQGKAGTAQNPFTPEGNRAMISCVPLREVSGSAEVMTTPFRRNTESPLSGVKCLSYAESIIIYNLALSAGKDEVLMANTHGNLCEGATANVFYTVGGVLRTPSLASGCLPGVTREILLEMCDAMGISVSQDPLSYECLDDVESAFLTSSLRNVQAIRSIDGRDLEVDTPLQVKLREALEAKIAAVS